MKEKTLDNELFFSIELKSKKDLKNLNLPNSSDESAVVEGNIGKLETAGFAEGEILEIAGKKGILRINLKPGELNLAGEVK